MAMAKELSEDDKGKMMYEYGYVILNKAFMAMNDDEFFAYRNWLSSEKFSVKGCRRFYEGKAKGETDEMYTLRRKMSHVYPNWFLLKCIARRIYDMDRARGIKHNAEYVTWMNTRAKGYHVVITSTGRVFHVLAKKSKFFGVAGMKGRDVVELHAGKDDYVDIADNGKDAKKYRHVLKTPGGETREIWSAQVKENIRKHLKESFMERILKRSLSCRKFERVMSYGVMTDKHVNAISNKICLGRVRDNVMLYFRGYKEVAGHVGMSYTAVRARFARCKGKEIEFNGEKYIVIDFAKRGEESKAAKKKHKKYPKKMTEKQWERCFMKNLKANRYVRKYMSRQKVKQEWKLLYDDYEGIRKAALKVGMMPLRSVVRYSFAGLLGDDSPRLEEWVDKAMKSLEHALRVLQLRRYWGRRSFMKRRAEFMQDDEKFGNWCKERGVYVRKREKISINDVFGTSFNIEEKQSEYVASKHDLMMS